MIDLISKLDKEIHDTIFLYKNLALSIFIFFIFYFIIFIHFLVNNSIPFYFINFSFFLLFLFYLHFLSIKNKPLYLKFKNTLNYLFIYNFYIHTPFLLLIYYSYYFIFIYLFIQSYRFYIFSINHSIKVINVQKCYNNNQNFWTYDVEFNNGIETKIITKRFSDFKNFSTKFNLNFNYIKWFFYPKSHDDVISRANQINLYLKTISTHNSILYTSVFKSFITNKENDNNIIFEKYNILDNNHNNDNNNNIEHIKKECSILINKTIDNIIILNEINYYQAEKKRILTFTSNCIYKIKFYITNNLFEIRESINYSYIDYIEISVIKNTFYFKNKKILIIYYKNKIQQFISINTNNFYNIDSAIDLFKQKKIIIIYTNDYYINTGLSITENILNNNSYKLIKNIYSDYYKYLFN